MMRNLLFTSLLQIMTPISKAISKVVGMALKKELISLQTISKLQQLSDLEK